MEAEFESRVLREIEEEVQSILQKSREVEDRVDSLIKQRVSYYRLLNGSAEEVARKIGEGEIVLFSLDYSDPEKARQTIGEVKKLIQGRGGRMYLIKSPVILAVPRETELRIHG